MSWEVKQQHVEKHAGRHYMVLHDPETGAEHHVVIFLSHDSCPTCGHVKPKTNTGEIDYQAILREEFAHLEAGNKNVDDYAKRHKLPVLKADGKAR